MEASKTPVTCPSKALKKCGSLMKIALSKKDIKRQVMQLSLHNRSLRSTSPGTSAQRAELIALTLGIDIKKRQDASLLFGLQTCFSGVTCPCNNLARRSLLTKKQSSIRHKQEILQLLEALYLPKQISVMHYNGSHGDISKVFSGNQKADRKVSRAALP